MGIVFTPEETDLGTLNIGQTFSFDISITYVEETDEQGNPLVPPDEDFITSVICTESEYDDVVVTESLSNVNISGDYPYEVFDQNYVTYVDKGSSDKIMTPVVTSPDNVPDYKDVFIVSVDPRITRDISYTIDVETNEGKTASATYTTTVIQDYSKMADWLQDYFENRYEV